MTSPGKEGTSVAFQGQAREGEGWEAKVIAGWERKRKPIIEREIKGRGTKYGGKKGKGKCEIKKKEKVKNIANRRKGLKCTKK